MFEQNESWFGYISSIYVRWKQHEIQCRFMIDALSVVLLDSTEVNVDGSNVSRYWCMDRSYSKYAQCSDMLGLSYML